MTKHPLIVRLNDRLKSDGYNFYYGVRENAYAMELTKIDRPINRGVYDSIWPKSNDMAEHPDQWADFVTKSGFRKFYVGHQPFYQKNITDVNQLLPVKQMQNWLEAQFPGIRYNGQRVVFSPLINGAHSAQKFTDQGYKESLMFICDAKSFDRSALTKPQIEGQYSGIVFTEIDHNFVNPISDNYLPAINETFSDREKWTSKGDATSYGSAYEVFNEYMTHAVHLLYIKDTYSADVYALVRRTRIELNGPQRGFYRFEAFLDKLQQLYASRKPGETVADLYPTLLTWAKNVQ